MLRIACQTVLYKTPSASLEPAHPRVMTTALSLSEKSLCHIKNQDEAQ